MDLPPQPSSVGKPRWQSVGAVDRRVLGVLVEKAKTTPESYPLSINAIATAANQKSNRAPIMNIDADAVQDSLDRLRALGAVAEVQGGGRVPRFRHLLYEWLGVDKVELAVMAELLLRGAQTEGDLRGRAARMEPIADVTALRPVLTSLKQKGLVIPLTPEGRGHVLTHALYEPRELERLRAEQGTMDQSAATPSIVAPSPIAPPVTGVPPAMRHQPPAAATQSDVPELRAEIAALRREVDELRGTLDELRQDLARLRAELG